jgi:ASC-1-like (ASCH) protein
MSQTIYKEHLSEPWFSLISLGLKTCEGRLHKHRFQTYKVGDIVMWFNDDFGKTRFVMTEITRTYVMETFKDFLTDNFHGGLKDALPGMPSLSHGLQVYQKYFTKEDEKKYGVVSFDLKVLHLCTFKMPNMFSLFYKIYVKSITKCYTFNVPNKKIENKKYKE